MYLKKKNLGMVDIQSILKEASNEKSIFDSTDTYLLKAFGLDSTAVETINASLATLPTKREAVHDEYYRLRTGDILEENQRGRTYLAGRDAESLGQTEKLLTWVLSLRSFLYFERIRSTMKRITFPRILATSASSLNPKLLESGENTLDVLIYPTVNIWGRPKSEHSAMVAEDNTMITMTFIVILMGKLNEENIPRIVDTLEPLDPDPLSLPITVSRDCVWADLASGKTNLANVFRKVYATLRNAMAADRSSFESSWEKIEKTRMSSVLMSLTDGESLVRSPDYSLKPTLEGEDRISKLTRLLGRLTWAISADEGLESLKTGEAAHLLADLHVLKGRTSDTFLNRRNHMLLHLSSLRDNFPKRSSLWFLASSLMAVENVSVQLATIYEYNDFIEEKKTGNNLAELTRLREEQIRDLEQFYNIETEDYFFRQEIEALQSILRITRMYDILREKIEHAASSLLVTEQSMSERFILVLTQGSIALTFLLGLSAFFLGVQATYPNSVFTALAVVSIACGLAVLFYVLRRLRVIGAIYRR